MTTTALVREATTVTATERRAQQQELWKRYKKAPKGGDLENDIVNQYLPLVKTVVGRLAMTLPAHVDAEDLHSAGLVGLLSAIRNFDLKSGTAFETYARVRIRGSVFDELRRMDWVPRSIHDKARKVQAAINALEQATGRIPSTAEMALALKLPVSEYEELLEEIRPATFVCLDAAPAVENSDHWTQYESIADESQEDPMEGTANREMTRLIAERLEQLPEMQRKVLALYYFEDLRLREIAEAFGLTESRICQIHAQAVHNIKAYLQKNELCPA